jgi:two-component sensor histidine kinase
VPRRRPERATDRRLRVTWRGSGGPVVELPRRRDFGSRLIERGLARELDGEVRTDCNAAGLICTADRPILNTDTAGFEP